MLFRWIRDCPNSVHSILCISSIPLFSVVGYSQRVRIKTSPTRRYQQWGGQNTEKINTQRSKHTHCNYTQRRENKTKKRRMMRGEAKPDTRDIALLNAAIVQSPSIPNQNCTQRKKGKTCFNDESFVLTVVSSAANPHVNSSLSSSTERFGETYHSPLTTSDRSIPLTSFSTESTNVIRNGLTTTPVVEKPIG